MGCILQLCTIERGILKNSILAGALGMPTSVADFQPLEADKACYDCFAPLPAVEHNSCLTDRPHRAKMRHLHDVICTLHSANDAKATRNQRWAARCSTAASPQAVRTTPMAFRIPGNGICDLHANSVLRSHSRTMFVKTTMTK